MKKVFRLFLAMSAILMLSQCGENEEMAEEIEALPMTPEDNKEKIQSEAVNFVNEMALLQETNTTQSLISLGLILDNAASSSARQSVQGIESLVFLNKSIYAVSHQKISFSDFARVTTEAETLEELWDEAKGEYTWNSSTETWDFTEGGDVVSFAFPSTEDGTSNNAVITLREYVGITIAGNPLDESGEYTGDLPASFTMDMFVDEVKEMEYTFDIEYTSDGEPESVVTALFMNPFNLSVSLTNTETLVSNSLNFSNGDNTIISVSTEANGNFTESAIEDAGNSEDPTDVVTSASTSLTLMDMKFDASMDIVNLYAEVGELETYYDTWDDGPRPDLEQNAEILEAALNEYAPITVGYVSSSGTAITAEWYTYLDRYDYYDGNYEDYIATGARMVFADGSKVDIEDFFETGFSELESEINDLIDAIGNDVGEDIDNVDF